MSKTLKYSLGLAAIIAGINFLIYSFIGFISKIYNLTWWNYVGLILISSIVTAAVVTLAIIITAPILKDYLATLRRLWRLENLSHPLLVRMSQEAPSTYYHSIIVANLAYRAAKAIGADAILTRLGGYYHDIGKLSRPELYIENSPNQNFLVKIEPTKAVKLITNHVKEGLKLAKQYDFPPELTAFITQHHGTTTVSYFYEKARQQGQSISKQEFRYPGPKPLSKEAAILMLADGIEAKTRSLSEFNDKSINETVEIIFNDKINDNQFELSGLTPNELRKIKTAFVESIKIMNHRRIKYARDGRK